MLRVLERRFDIDTPAVTGLEALFHQDPMRDDVEAQSSPGTYLDARLDPKDRCWWDPPQA
jgi:hypothetical protein